MNMENLNLTETVKWLVYSGGSVIVASWILDKIPAFVKLTSDAKYIIAMAISILLALGFYAILVYVPVQVLASLEPWFLVVTGTVAIYAAGQKYHQATKA